MSAHQLGRARVLIDLGQLAEARAVLDTLGGTRTSTEVTGRLGLIAALEARAVDADSSVTKLATAPRAYQLGEPAYWQAVIEAARGNRSRAVEHLRDSFAQGKHRSMSLHNAPELEPLRGYADFESLIRPRTRRQ